DLEVVVPNPCVEAVPQATAFPRAFEQAKAERERFLGEGKCTAENGGDDRGIGPRDTEEVSRCGALRWRKFLVQRRGVAPTRVEPGRRVVRGSCAALARPAAEGPLAPELRLPRRGLS